MSLIVFLHGASSSGKTALADAICRQGDRSFLRLSFDTLRDGGALAGIVPEHWSSLRQQVFDGLHSSMAAFANAGCDLIVEHVLDTEAWHATLKDVLATHQVVFVGLDVPEATLNAREAGRGDRPRGSAARDARHIHTGLVYDLTLDGTASPEDNAAAVWALVRTPPACSRFFT